MIGYNTKSISPAAAELTIELNPQRIQLGEVVVTARKRRKTA